MNEDIHEVTTSESRDSDRGSACDANGSEVFSQAQDSPRAEGRATDFVPTLVAGESTQTPYGEPHGQIEVWSDHVSTPVLDRSLAQRLANSGINDIVDLSLQARTYNVLRMNHIRTVSDLVGIEQNDLLRLPQFQADCLADLRKKIAEAAADHTPTTPDDSIYRLKLDPRTFNTLWRNHIRTISALRALNKEELLGLHGVGPRSLNELLQKLEAYDPGVFEAVQRAPGPSLLEPSIKSLQLQPRTFNILWKNRVRTISALTMMTEKQLLSMRGFGPGCVNDVSERLNAMQTSLQTTAEEHRELQMPLFDLPLQREFIEQFHEVASRLCEPFESQGLLEELKLPSQSLPVMRSAFGQDVKSLSEMRQLAAHPDTKAKLADSLRRGRVTPLKKALAWLEEAATHHSLDDELEHCVSHLTERQKVVLLGRFRLLRSETLEAIGIRYGITRERVRQIENKVRARVTHRTSVVPLFYSRAAFLLLERMGEDAALDLWKQKLAEIGYVKSDKSIDLLLAIALAGGDSDLGLSEQLVVALRSRMPSSLSAHVKPVLNVARGMCRKCGAVRAASLAGEGLSETNVGRILSSRGFTEILPGWWSRERGVSVPSRVAMKVIAHFGPVSPSIIRHCLRRHLYRFGLPVPPSEVLARALERTGEFVVEGGVIRLAKPALRKPPLNSPEEIFVEMVRSQGPVVSFESTYEELLKAGFSGASVSRLLSQSAIVHKVAYKLYTLVGRPYDFVDVERAKNDLTRVSTNPSVRLRTDGIVEFETNIGNFMVYGGILGAGPVVQMQGTWTLVVDGEIQGELLVQGAFIQNMEPARDGLGLEAGDRIKIEFNTWTREATVRKVTNHDQAA